MVKKLFLSTSTVFILMGCGGASNNTDTITSKSTHFGIDIENGSTGKTGNIEKDYIPKGKALTQEMAYKFLNMTTFGATPTLANELRTKGVEAWVEEQLSMPYTPKTQSILRGTLKWAKQMRPAYLQGNSIDEIIVNNNAKSTARGYYHEWETFVTSSLFDNMLRDKSQLRQRVAYALSQTIIASDSVDSFFRYSFHALAYYYDFLLEHAFENYADVLYDVSLTPAMATFLTYQGNRKAYTNTQDKPVNPDENYGRELMQLFTLGLYKLNIDGMQISNGTQYLETYTQKDINNMSRVFTGLTYPDGKFGARQYSADLIHPMVCEETYHDMEEKVILGNTLPSGQSCEEDIKSAIDVLMKHQNIAPFISKKLILRLTKSNPKAEYIQRVAQVFNNNGNGVKGDLKAVVKAILLDKEIWENITKGFGTKIKEPYIAHMGMLRAFDVQALPRIAYFTRSPKYVAKHFKNTQNKLFLYQYYNTRNSYKSFAQSPLVSPTVFNFYEDTFVPNNKMMRMYNFVAPELQIQTTPYIIKFSQRIDYLLQRNDKGGVSFLNSGEKKYYDSRRYDSFIIDTTWVYDEALKVVQDDFHNLPSSSDKNAIQTYKNIVEKIVDSLSWRLYGKYLNKEKKQIYIDNYAKDIIIAKNNTELVVKQKLHRKVIQPILQQLIMSDDYMVQ